MDEEEPAADRALVYDDWIKQRRRRIAKMMDWSGDAPQLHPDAYAPEMNSAIAAFEIEEARNPHILADQDTSAEELLRIDARTNFYNSETSVDGIFFISGDLHSLKREVATIKTGVGFCAVLLLIILVYLIFNSV